MVNRKFVLSHYLLTDKRTEKRMDRDWDHSKSHNNKHNFFIFIQIALKYLYNLAFFPRILKLCLDSKLVDGKFDFLHYLQANERTDKRMNRDLDHSKSHYNKIISLFLFRLLRKYLYNLAFYPRIWKLCLDSKLVDRKLVYLHYRQTNGQTKGRTEILTIGRVIIENIISFFFHIAYKIPL